MVEKLSDANFEEQVMKSELPVLVDFYADWCGPCRMMAKSVERMAETYAGRMRVGKLNVDENPQQTDAFHVMSIPYIAVIRNGQVAGSVLGAVPEDELSRMIEKAIG